MSEKRTFEFTDRALKGLPVPPKPQQLDYFDSKARGLGLRISYGGRRPFFAMYSNSAGKRQRVSMGEYGRREYGTLSLASDGAFTYLPAADFHGTDAFTYLVNDGFDDSGVATVTVNLRPINVPPHAIAAGSVLA